MAGVKLKPYEVEILTKDGEKVPYEVNASKINYKGKSADMVIFRDISERKKTEEELKKLASVVKHSSELVNLAALDGKMIFLNESGGRMLGINPDEVHKHVILDVIPKDLQSKVKNEVLPSIIEKGKWEGELQYKNIKTGVITDVQAQTFMIKDSIFNKPLYFANVSLDITKRKKAEEKLIQQNIKLKKLDKLKSDFLNVTSHELRTPMTAMKGYLQMLMGDKFGKLTDGQVKALDVILRNTNRLDNLVVDILDTSRLESGTMKFMPELVDTKKLMDEVVETMQNTNMEKKIKIISDSEFELPDLTIDKDRIKQVFNNLITNAMKFSPENSEIHLRANIWKNDVLFEVQDFGKGIPKDELEKIFEVFYQVDSGVDRSFGGTGLGLSISQGIVLGHGGRLWVESEEGKGSTFKFTLPLKPVNDVEGTFAKLDMFKVKNDNQRQGADEDD
jgi:PAS domain S-box-containing protein